MRYKKDKAAIKRYIQEYAKLDGTAQGLKNSLKAIKYYRELFYGLSN